MSATMQSVNNVLSEEKNSNHRTGEARMTTR